MSIFKNRKQAVNGQKTTSVIKNRKQAIEELNQRCRAEKKFQWSIEKDAFLKMLSIPTGDGMTAEEIANHPLCDLTVSEVVANLTAILLTGKTCKRNYKAEDRVSEPFIYHNRHNIREYLVFKLEDYRTKYLAQTDRDGNILKGKPLIKKDFKVTVYIFNNESY